MSAEDIANQNNQDLIYKIQADKIALNAKPREQQPPKKSISKVDAEMIQDYNKQFEKNINIKSIYYVGKSHFLYFYDGVVNDIIDNIKTIIHK